GIGVLISVPIGASFRSAAHDRRVTKTRDRQQAEGEQMQDCTGRRACAATPAKPAVDTFLHICLWIIDA
ncbi:MAG: hypothetical protein ACREPT_01950, partial [Rudaea sp.]